MDMDNLHFWLSHLEPYDWLTKYLSQGLRSQRQDDMINTTTLSTYMHVVLEIPDSFLIFIPGLQ